MYPDSEWRLEQHQHQWEDDMKLKEEREKPESQEEH